MFGQGQPQLEGRLGVRSSPGQRDARTAMRAAPAARDEGRGEEDPS